MSLSTDDRLQFVQWMSDLGPDCDRSRILHFVSARREEALAELVEVPGYEQVRAGLLRLLPELIPDDDARNTILADVGSALTTPLGDDAGRSGDLIIRHPAWIGLSVLELCELLGRDDGGLEWATELAGSAFLAQGAENDVARGEILWAMAEQAEEVGWLNRTAALLDLAYLGPFAFAEHQQQVGLLLALRCVEKNPKKSESLLDVIIGSESSDEQTLVHAIWVKAHLLKDQNDEIRIIRNSPTRYCHCNLGPTDRKNPISIRSQAP